MIKTINIIILSLFCNVIFAVKPFYNFGLYQKPIHYLRSELTKALLENNFEIVGMFNPASEDSLDVIVFTCDELTSLATGVTDKGAFGATLKIGLIGMGDHTLITMLNPNYFIHAYFNCNANIESVNYICSKVDSLCMNALSGFSIYPEEYGFDVSLNELKDYHFLPTMAKFSDVVELQEYDEYLEAVSTIKFNILNGVDGSELIYELSFEDKEIAVFGVSFTREENIEDELLEFIGAKCISSLPMEIVVQGNKAYILNPKYRIPLYKPEISITKLFRIISISSEIKECMRNIAKL